MAEMTAFHLPHRIFKSLLRCHRDRVLGHLLLDLYSFLFLTHWWRASRHRGMFRILRFQALVLHQLNFAIGQDVLNFFGSRYALFNPKGRYALVHRFLSQLYEIDPTIRINLHNIDPVGNIAQTGIATQSQQTLTPWKDRDDLKAQSQKFFYGDVALAIGIGA